MGRLIRKEKISYGRQTITQDDIKAVTDVLRSDWLSQGPKIREFEEALCRYTGAKYAVAVTNGTAALHTACLAAGIGPGDEVITSPVTFLASANCVVYCGGTPVFADIDEKTV
ncbi:MAG TPA: aminotransferase class I/II-fold pyridoxal phosphate-dependent enzyme, partial [Candidatus Omnitrophota bacterium]|nr:aminotransferase class I/II-fold pyridoxal phosphate-dependent enzyme [Candidatus Omnitrophota bacterium]